MTQSIPVAGRGRRRTKPTKRGASTLAGLDQWSGLFDRCYLDHCCEAIARAVRGEIGAEDMAGTIRQFLIAPLDSYISDEAAAGRFASTNVSAAHRLIAKAKEIADVLAESRSVGPHETDVEKLRIAWLEFVVEGAGPAIYDGLLTAQKQRAAAAKRPRGNGAKLTLAELAQRVAPGDGTRVPEWRVLELAREFGVDERTVYRRLADLRKKTPRP